MYADKAHFIYELIQNADDARATKIKFILKRDELYFLHNGKEKFSLSDPGTEDIDSQNNKLGHINSITSVGNTTKSEQKIGKFGIGFKSVFQYTNSPIIQDDSFSFQIKKLFVPYQYDKIYNHRSKGETLFVVPFDKNKQEAFDDSKNKFEKFDETILLFLNSIEEMQFQYLGKNKLVRKKVIKESIHKISETGFDKIRSSVIKIESNKYLLFKGYIQEEGSTVEHKIAVAYPLNKHNDFQSEFEYSAYCFFPTQEKTGLKFLIHAPFLLTDNRQNLKRDLNWNEGLIDNLADLVYDSFLIMKKLKYINNKFYYSLPLDTEKYKSSFFYNQDLFQAIYQKIKEALTENEIVPTKNGKYVKASNAFLIRVKELSGLLDNITLSDLKHSEKAAVVFPEITEGGKTARLWNFLKDVLEVEVIDSKDFIRQIDESFLSSRSDVWLKSFYNYCLTIPSLWEKLKELEIIRLENGKNVKPFVNDVAQVFLKEVDPEYPQIKQTFLEDKNSLDFFKKIGIGYPDERDIIFRTIIQRYDHEEFSIDDDILLRDFENILTYYFDCNEESKSELIKQLSNKCIIVTKSRDDEESHLNFPNKVYLRNQLLDKYFEGNSDYIYVDEDYYKEIISKHDREKVNKFFQNLGLESIPRITLNDSITLREIGVINHSWGRETSIIDYIMDGFNHAVKDISLTKSVIIWGFLKDLSCRVNLSQYRNGLAEYFYRKKRTHSFTSTFFKNLTQVPWLFNNNEELFCSNELFIQDLHPLYDRKGSDTIIEFLELKDNFRKYSLLSEEERKSISLVQELINAGIKPEELDEKRSELKDLILNYFSKPEIQQTGASTITRKSIGKKITLGKDDIKVIIDPKRPVDFIIKEKIKIEKSEKSEDVLDDDDLTPKTTVTADQLESIKKKLENEAELLNKVQSLKEKLNESEVYTLGWFNALLELEYFDRKDREFKKSSLYVVFKKIEIDPLSDKTLILSGAQYIPESIEDNESLALVLTYENRQHSVLVEAVSRQNKILKAKLRDNVDIKDLSIEQVNQAEIEIKNANFIFESLKDSFKCFNSDPFSFNESYNFKNNLPDNIDIIFGPPGTGKTTYLAKNIIHPLTKKNGFKILVLTPTNKAGDVLTNKLIEICENEKDNSYLDWLIRFGITNDPDLEGVVYHNSKYLKGSPRANLVLVTTVARFTYDTIFFEDTRENGKYLIRDFDWDYIIFDESSMINLPSTVFSLFYRFTKYPRTKFVFGGDPFQINPIVFVNEPKWKEGNIFSLLELDKKGSFINPKPNPSGIKVTNLTKQFRSIPQIGSLFSQLTYDNKLEHFRDYSSTKLISINNLDLHPITIINFKIGLYDSIYRSHRLKGSPYHIYSSIFVIELLEYVINNIELKNCSAFSIGIICPYRAQQSIIDKLSSTLKIPKSISVTTGTIHGFQGDECDMIISLFNPPKNVSRSEEIFLNKHNIINVSISRARDYLILLTPYDPSNRISVNELFIIEQVKEICASDKEIKKVFKSFFDYEIEKIIFGKPTHIEEISFPTAHQDVNIYSAIDRKYEVRYDENAVDIQVKK